jgi:hypothetical protein
MVDGERDPAGVDTTNPPPLLFAIGVVFIFVGVSLNVFDHPTDTVRGIPNPLFGWTCILIGAVSTTAGFRALHKRRSARRRTAAPPDQPLTSAPADTDQDESQNARREEREGGNPPPR